MSRFKAAAIHLVISVAIVAVFLALTFFVWYPPPYFEADGADYLLGLLGGVDVVLGPTLTLIVFKAGKPGLKFDLGMIAAVQVAALAYGGHIIFEGRTGYVVFAVDRFNIISASEVDATKIKYPDLRASVFGGPRLVYARLPEDSEVAKNMALEVIAGAGRDIEARPELYEPYESNRDEVAAKARSVSDLALASQAASVLVEKFAAKHDTRVEDLSFVPLVGKNKDMVMMIDSRTGDPMGAIDADPWI